MTDNITINDGTTTRVYNSQGRLSVVKGSVTHVRKTDERDMTPETLVVRQEQKGVNTYSRLALAKTKVNATTGKSATATYAITVTSNVSDFSQAETEAGLAELVALLAISGMKADIALLKT